MSSDTSPLPFAEMEVRHPAQRLEDPERVTVRVAPDQKDVLDDLVEDRVYKDQSKAIRDGVDYLLEDGGRGRHVTSKENGRRITIRLPRYQYDALEALVDAGVYPNRSVAFRDAIEYLIEHLETEAVLDT